MTVHEKDDSSSHQNIIKVPHFYFKQQRSRFTFRYLMLKENLKC